MSGEDPGLNAPAPQIIYVQAPAPRRRSLIKRVTIGCVAATTAAGILIGLHGCGSGTPTNDYQGPGTVQTAPKPAPDPPLSKVPPRLTGTAQIDVASLGGQAWIDVAVELSNGGPPAQDVTIALMQSGKPLVITDSAGTATIPGAAFLPSVPTGFVNTLVLRADNWQKGPPITVVLRGNGTHNATDLPVPVCPTSKYGSQIPCNVLR